ncbi:MAG: Hint domain-containing protein [Pseudomonadota bacterium]
MDYQAHTYSVGPQTPFSDRVGGIATFGDQCQRTLTAPFRADLTWQVQDLTTGDTVWATQQADQSAPDGFTTLQSSRPLVTGRAYRTVCIEPSDRSTIYPHADKTDRQQRLGLSADTLIMTAKGEVRADTLVAGDRLVTRDHGMQPLIWVGKCERTHAICPTATFPTGAINNARPLTLAPNTCVLVKGAEALSMFGKAEVLVSAHHLMDSLDSKPAKLKSTKFVQLIFARHEIIYADAAAAESFLADEAGLAVLPSFQDPSSVRPDVSHTVPARPVYQPAK